MWDVDCGLAPVTVHPPVRPTRRFDLNQKTRLEIAATAVRRAREVHRANEQELSLRLGRKEPIDLGVHHSCLGVLGLPAARHILREASPAHPWLRFDPFEYLLRTQGFTGFGLW